VSKILKDTTDYEQCGEDRQDAYVYADPKLVQCFVKPDGGGQS
jgi:hypothetical protein